MVRTGSFGLKVGDDLGVALRQGVTIGGLGFSRCVEDFFSFDPPPKPRGGRVIGNGLCFSAMGSSDVLFS